MKAFLEMIVNHEKNDLIMIKFWLFFMHTYFCREYFDVGTLADGLCSGLLFYYLAWVRWNPWPRVRRCGLKSCGHVSWNQCSCELYWNCFLSCHDNKCLWHWSQTRSWGISGKTSNQIFLLYSRKWSRASDLAVDKL